VRSMQGRRPDCAICGAIRNSLSREGGKSSIKHGLRTSPLADARQSARIVRRGEQTPKPDTPSIGAERRIYTHVGPLQDQHTLI